MKLNRFVAGAAIGCTLGAAGIAWCQAPPAPHPRALQGRHNVRVAQAVRVVRATHLRATADPVTVAVKTVPAARPATSADPAAHQATSADPAAHRETSVARTNTIGGHRGIRRTTTGADDSTRTVG
jgi:hypothetical protein